MVIVRYRETGDTHRYPFVTNDIVNGQPFLGVSLEATLDELLGVLGDISPLWVGELVLARSDPPLHARRYWQSMIGIERWEPTQPGVK